MTRRGLEKTGTFLRGAVEIAIKGQAGLGRCRYESCGKRIRMPEIGNRQRAALAVKLVFSTALVLSLLEIGEDIVIAPALIAMLAPAIVILVLTANVKQAVDRTRSAKHLPARLKHP